jgi:hypothetical protein
LWISTLLIFVEENERRQKRCQSKTTMLNVLFSFDFVKLLPSAATFQNKKKNRLNIGITNQTNVISAWRAAPTTVRGSRRQRVAPSPAARAELKTTPSPAAGQLGIRPHSRRLFNRRRGRNHERRDGRRAGYCNGRRRSSGAALWWSPRAIRCGRRRCCRDAPRRRCRVPRSG